MVLSFDAILDPSKKLNLLKYPYSKLNPYGYEEKIERVKKSLYALFEEYSNKCASISMILFLLMLINHQILLKKKWRSCPYMM